MWPFLIVPLVVFRLGLTIFARCLLFLFAFASFTAHFIVLLSFYWLVSNKGTNLICKEQ